MVVFLYVLLLITIIILIILFSTIEIELEKFKIQDAITIEKLISFLLKGEKDEILKLLKFSIKLRFLFLGIIPYFKINLSNKTINRIISKKSIINEIKKIDRINIKKSKVYSFIKIFEIKKIELYSKIGLKDAYITAILTGLVNSIFGFLMPYISKKSNQISNYKYKIKPIYSEDYSFYFEISLVIRTNIIQIIMNKIITNFKNIKLKHVNNTNIF